MTPNSSAWQNNMSLIGKVDNMNTAPASSLLFKGRTVLYDKWHKELEGNGECLKIKYINAHCRMKRANNSVNPLSSSFPLSVPPWILFDSSSEVPTFTATGRVGESWPTETKKLLFGTACLIESYGPWPKPILYGAFLFLFFSLSNWKNTVCFKIQRPIIRHWSRSKEIIEYLPQITNLYRTQKTSLSHFW